VQVELASASGCRGGCGRGTHASVGRSVQGVASTARRCASVCSVIVSDSGFASRSRTHTSVALSGVGSLDDRRSSGTGDTRYRLLVEDVRSSRALTDQDLDHLVVLFTRSDRLVDCVDPLPWA